MGPEKQDHDSWATVTDHTQFRPFCFNFLKQNTQVIKKKKNESSDLFSFRTCVEA